MNTLKRYNNLFVRELVHIEFKIQSRENNVENLIPLSNNNNDYLFYNTSLSSSVARDRKRVIK